MLLSLVPPADVLSAISPLVCPEALLSIVYELAIVTNVVGVEVDAAAMHVVVLPLAIVFAPVRPEIDAEPTYVIT